MVLEEEKKEKGWAYSQSIDNLVCICMDYVSVASIFLNLFGLVSPHFSDKSVGGETGERANILLLYYRPLFCVSAEVFYSVTKSLCSD